MRGMIRHRGRVKVLAQGELDRPSPSGLTPSVPPPRPRSKRPEVPPKSFHDFAPHNGAGRLRTNNELCSASIGTCSRSRIFGKILFTVAIFAVYRLGASIPVPGIDLEAVARFASVSSSRGGIYGLLNLFSGGALESFSVFSLGIMPYITASIIMQLLTVVIPRLQALQEEGESGRRIITQWTRYVTVGLALVTSVGSRVPLPQRRIHRRDRPHPRLRRGPGWR